MHVHVTVTSALFHPFPFAAGARLSNVITGADLSMLMSICVSLAVLPARSMHVPVMDWPAPSVVRVSITVAETGPDKPSVQLHWKVMLLANHPLTFGDAGVVPANAIVGAVLSTLMPLMVALAELSALSTA